MIWIKEKEFNVMASYEDLLLVAELRRKEDEYHPLPYAFYDPKRFYSVDPITGVVESSYKLALDEIRCNYIGDDFMVVRGNGEKKDTVLSFSYFDLDIHDYDLNELQENYDWFKVPKEKKITIHGDENMRLGGTRIVYRSLDLDLQGSTEGEAIIIETPYFYDLYESLCEWDEYVPDEAELEKIAQIQFEFGCKYENTPNTSLFSLNPNAVKAKLWFMQAAENKHKGAEAKLHSQHLKDIDVEGDMNFG